jgi:hypothetical protein
MDTYTRKRKTAEAAPGSRPRLRPGTGTRCPSRPVRDGSDRQVRSATPVQVTRGRQSKARHALDDKTQLSKPRHYWHFAVYQSVGEAVVTYISEPSSHPIGEGRWAELPAEEKQWQKRQRTVRRARTRSRRYIIHNRLHVHVTLTYRPGEPGLASR